MTIGEIDRISKKRGCCFSVIPCGGGAVCASNVIGNCSVGAPTSTRIDSDCKLLIYSPNRLSKEQRISQNIRRIELRNKLWSRMGWL